MGINEYAMWNYKNETPDTSSRLRLPWWDEWLKLCPASYWWTAPTDLRPVVLDVTEQVVNSICTFKWQQRVPLLVISVQKQFTAEEVNFSDMIKYL